MRTGIRIISGSLKGKTIDVPAGFKVRPMRTRIRAAFFNMLGKEILGARFLDVFAGSGSVAIEALSRGAHRAVLIENDPEVLDVLSTNLMRLGLRRRAQLACIDPYTTLPGEEEPFRHVFVDPPFPHYRTPELDPWGIAGRLVTASLLAPGARIGIEYPTRLEPPDPPEGLTLEKTRKYGDTSILMWRRDAE